VFLLRRRAIVTFRGIILGSEKLPEVSQALKERHRLQFNLTISKARFQSLHPPLDFSC